MITKNTAEFYDNYIISHGLYIFVRSLVETKHISIISIEKRIFIRPSSDGTYYGMVMSVRPGLHPTLRPSVRVSVLPTGSPSARFPHFSPTCFDILSWNYAYDFVLINYRSSSSVVTLRQVLKELCLFGNLKFRKCEVFRTFSYMLWHIELKFCIWFCFNVL